MQLTDEHLDRLKVPKFAYLDYDAQIRSGKILASKSNLLIYIDNLNKNASLIESLRSYFQYSVVTNSIEYPHDDFHYFMYLDSNLYWWLIDGIIHSLGLNNWKYCAANCLYRHIKGWRTILSCRLIDNSIIIRSPREIGEQPIPIKEFYRGMCLYNLISDRKNGILNPNMIAFYN